MLKRYVLCIFILFSVLVFPSCLKKKAITKKQARSSYFNGNVKLIIPYQKGSTYDLAARKFAKIANRLNIEKGIDSNIYCEQLTGSGALLATDYFTTLSSSKEKAMIVLSYDVWYRELKLGENFNIDLTKIKAIGSLADESFMLFVKPGVYSDFDEFTSVSKRHEMLLAILNNDDEALYCMANLMSPFGGKFASVRYESLSSAAQALQDREVDCLVTTIANGLEFVQNKDMVPLLVFGDSSSGVYSDYSIPLVSSSSSLGYSMANIAKGAFLCVPEGLETDDISEIKNVLVEVWEDKEFNDFMTQNYLNKFKLFTPDIEKHIYEAQNAVKVAMKYLEI